MGIFFTDQFFEYLKYQKKYSLHTLLAYEKDLEDFIIFAEKEFEISHPAEISNDMVRSWVSRLIGQDIAPVSVRRKISSLRTYIKFLLKEQRIEKNPIVGLPVLKLSKKLPVVVSSDNISAIIEGLPENANYSERLNHLIICLLYGTGIRRAELMAIKVEDVNFSLRQIKVLGKRSKERIVPLTHELAGQISNFMELKASKLLSSEFLLVNQKNKPLYPGYIYNVVKKTLTLHKVNGRRGPHILRHTYATHLLQNGAELLSVKELLGHSSLVSTQVYTHVNIEDLKKTYKKNHPKQ